MEDTQDISRATVVILVVLTLAVSMIGTWAVLEEVVRVDHSGVGPADSSGKVQLRIVNPGDAPAPDIAASSAKVGITITPTS